MFLGRHYVSVDSRGEIRKSSDGTNWEIIQPVLREYLKKVACANGQYVAVGGSQSPIGGPRGSGAIYSSPDGLNWSVFASPYSELLSDCAYGGGVWVVTGHKGIIFTSPNGIDWQDLSSPEVVGHLNVVVRGAGRFVAFPYRADRVYHSEDGTNWQIVDGPEVSDVREAVYSNDRFIAVGDDGLVATSIDGIDWQTERIHPSADFSTVCFGKGRYVLGGSNHIAVSTDLETWEIYDFQLAPREIHYVDGWFISNDFRISRDGVQWEAARNTFPKYFRMESMSIVGNTFLGAQGFELWKAELDLDKTVGLTLFPHGGNPGIEYTGEVGYRYRLWESANLRDWNSSSEWKTGSGDHLLWEIDLINPSSFWRIETEPVTGN